MGIFDKLLEEHEKETQSNAHVSIDDLINLAQIAGIDQHGVDLTKKEIMNIIPKQDWSEISKTEQQDLRIWASCLALSAVKQAGLIPAGWDKVSNCKQCGKVWSDHGLDMLYCGWCHIRETGNRFPRPI